MKIHYHFIGIGGIGMGAVASLLLEQGHHVSGSDVQENKIIENLRLKGASVTIGHRAENVNGANMVVFSSAISSDNPEMKEAKEKGINIFPRAELLADLMKAYEGITVAGSHGKTTTTSMIAHLLYKAGLKPTTAVGGIINGVSSNAYLGEGKYFVAEVDESDGSFLNFSPKYSVITNIDFEHVDYYRNWDAVLDAYEKYISHTQKGGHLIAWGDDKQLRNFCIKEKYNLLMYGFSDKNDLIADNLVLGKTTLEFDCIFQNQKLGKVMLNVPGKHNVLNALACIGLGHVLKIDFDTIAKSLQGFRGVQRRFQWKGEANGIQVVDDYAHHPTEIKWTLEAAQALKSKRLIVAFQPHRYSRLNSLIDQMASSLTNCDYLIVTDVYAASEEPIKNIDAKNLIDRIKKETDMPVVYCKKESIADHIFEYAKPGDLVLTLGAGDITKISDELIEKMNKIGNFVKQ